MSGANDILNAFYNFLNGMTSGSPPVLISAYNYAPLDPSAAQCPFFVNFPRGGPTTFHAVPGRHMVTNNIKVTLCVARKEAGQSAQAVYEYALTFRDDVFAIFATHIRLNNTLPSIVDVYITAWDFLPDFPLGSTVYVALQFNVRVTEALVIPVAP